MSIIHGSQGIIYFCHQFQPLFLEVGLLADEEMTRGVGRSTERLRASRWSLIAPRSQGRHGGGQPDGGL